ncbi:hypothetical protein SDJN03_29947, partial [Cucurbita argyrosperma subsp. sororia]
MAGIVKEILARPIQLADQVTKNADCAQTFKQECIELKTKTEKLATLLRQAARPRQQRPLRASHPPHHRRHRASSRQGLHPRHEMSFQWYNETYVHHYQRCLLQKNLHPARKFIGDVSWLLRVSIPAEDRDDEYLGLPPIASNEPILGLIWEQVAILHTGTLEERSDAAASLASLARDNDRYGKLIIEEGGVVPLLKLAKEGEWKVKNTPRGPLGYWVETRRAWNRL